MISAGVEGRLPYMTYPEPWRGPPKQPPELFLRPAPKPLPPSTRYNGVNTTTYPNGTRLAPAPSTITKYPSPPSLPSPVNLTQKEVPDEMTPYSHYGLFTHAPQFSHFPYPVCQPPYMMRANFPPTPLSPMETFSPSTPTSTTTFLSPPSAYSPPSSLKTSQSLVREKKLAQQPIASSSLPAPSSNQTGAFKVPSGKEGSLKHRILTRPDDPRSSGPLDLQKASEGRKRLQATMSPPRSPKKPLNNNTLPSNFAKGSLIQLHTGELRRIEDMRTEDFIMSAERSPELRLAESTVLRIEENSQKENATITLAYNNRRAQVDVESRVEHPYFVMGQGWASCNPDRTQQCYGLKVHRLRVGDVLISLTPRETPASCPSSRSGARAGTTIMTTATTTSMTARQQPVNSVVKTQLAEPKVCITQTQPMNLHLPSHRPPQSMSPESLAARKRRWSAPDQICEEEEMMNRRRQRVE